MKNVSILFFLVVALAPCAWGMENNNNNNESSKSLVPKSRSSSLSANQTLITKSSNRLSALITKEKYRQDAEKKREKTYQEKLQNQKSEKKEQLLKQKAETLRDLANKNDAKAFAQNLVSYLPINATQDDRESKIKVILGATKLDESEQESFFQKATQLLARRDPNRNVEYKDLVNAVESRDAEEFAWCFKRYEISNGKSNQTANELLLQILSAKNFDSDLFKQFFTEALTHIQSVDRDMKLHGKNGAYTLAKKHGPKVADALKETDKAKQKNQKDSEKLQQELKERFSVDSESSSKSSRNSSVGIIPAVVNKKEKKKASKKSEHKSEENKSSGFLALIQGLIPNQKKDKNKLEEQNVNTIEYKTLELDQVQLENLRGKHDSLPQELAEQEQARQSKILQDSKLD